MRQIQQKTHISLQIPSDYPIFHTPRANSSTVPNRNRNCVIVHLSLWHRQPSPRANVSSSAQSRNSWYVILRASADVNSASSNRRRSASRSVMNTSRHNILYRNVIPSSLAILCLPRPATSPTPRSAGPGTSPPGGTAFPPTACPPSGQRSPGAPPPPRTDRRTPTSAPIPARPSAPDCRAAA